MNIPIFKSRDHIIRLDHIDAVSMHAKEVFVHINGQKLIVKYEKVMERFLAEYKAYLSGVTDRPSSSYKLAASGICLKCGSIEDLFYNRANNIMCGDCIVKTEG